MSKFKLVITDVDGTLVTTDKTLTPSAIAAVGRLRDAGVHFSICSSRPPFGLRMMIDALQIKLPLGGYNGGAIVEADADLTVIEMKTIAPAAAKQAMAIFRRHNIDPWVFIGNEWVIANRQGAHVDHEIHTIHVQPTVVPAFEDKHFSAVGKIVGPSDDHPLVLQVAAEIQAALHGQVHAARSQAYYCDVIPQGIDKGRICEILGERLGIPREEILVLGDMENDLGMFRKAGFAVAMGNATDEVKGEAQGTTGSNDEDGWAQAIDRYVLGK
jgi:Cof subfamily protein (haloacid dehalogenase superfamily)